MTTKNEKCYFCERQALYTQPYDTQIIDVCRKHFSMALTS